MSETLEVVVAGGVTSAKGFVAGAVPARMRLDWDKPDVALLYSEAPCTAAGVFTQCKVVAAPVVITRKHLAGGTAQAVVANSGCANAATGEQGLADAVEMAQLAGAKLGLDPHDIVVASTGVIGTFLPMDRVRQGIEAVELSAGGGPAFARGIMTTDTRPKESAVRFGQYTLGGACKGAGMIHPNMATMLAFITTDAPVAAPFLSRALKEAVGVSFNMIDVDSDTSTNDTVVVLANGLADGGEISDGHPLAPAFAAALAHVCTDLAQQIVADAEGGTKVIEATVVGAASAQDARLAAREVVRSLAVKTAVYGHDPNWGRVLAAVGNSGCRMEEAKTALWLVDADGHELCLLKGGSPQPLEAGQAKPYFEAKEVRFRVDLGLGGHSAVAWGSDLTEEYVRLNSLYTT
ncbi:MAG: bifunctional glutamate N-acetyltransferase/amino-acid acetyltransferase ArgJ [Dehalococcoidia bacterium]|nr:bifunctional glutamate N-acetyltransferase/amino-acid acetyltransferase ArgJ [Dehalococcoidia bacterium]